MIELIIFAGIIGFSIFLYRIWNIKKELIDFIENPTQSIFIQDRNDTFTQIVNPMYMTAEDKQIYLKSVEWQKLRTLVFTRDNYTCQSCGSKSSLNAHHITYEDLGMESLDQLTTLCTTCHTALHKRLGYDRTTIYPIIKD